MIKAGSLVRYKGSVGLVIGRVKSGAAKKADVWVKWADDPKPRWEYGVLLEVLNESR